MQIENGTLKDVSDNDIKDWTFVIPKDVTKIGIRAFNDCASLKSIGCDNN